MRINKDFDVNYDIIMNEKDYKKVLEWSKLLNVEYAKYLEEISRYDRLLPKQKVYLAHIKGLIFSCKQKMKEYNIKLKEEGKYTLKADRKTARLLSSLFMKIAKETLPKEEYNKILEEAKKQQISMTE